jgi:hypothetical protein
MLKVYILPIERIENVEKVKGIEYIHDAILESTGKPNVRKLIMDTTSAEDRALSALAIEVRSPTSQEMANMETLPSPSPPPRDLTKELDELKARVGKLEKK